MGDIYTTVHELLPCKSKTEKQQFEKSISFYKSSTKNGVFSAAKITAIGPKLSNHTWAKITEIEKQK